MVLPALRRTGGDLRRQLPRIWHRLLQATRPAFWVLLRLVPPRPHAVIHGWPTFEGNVVELLPTLARRYGRPVYWLVDGDRRAAENHVRRFDLHGVHVVPKTSLQGVARATTAEATFFTHGLFTAVKPPANRLVVNLWHGDGPKTTTHAKDVASTVAVSGALMWKSYKARTFGLRDHDVACTGNPRTDALTRGLGADQFERLGLDPEGTLVLWLPTYRLGRNAGGLLWENGSLLSTRSTLLDLGSAATDAGLTLIVKPHPMDRDDYSSLGLRVLTDADLGRAGVGLYELLGSSRALISDTSSVWVDFLALDRPVGFFIPDADELARTRGFNVPDLFEILPGPLLRDVGDVADFLKAVVLNPEDADLIKAAERSRIGVVPLGNASERLLDWLDDYQVARGRPALFAGSRPGSPAGAGAEDTPRAMRILHVLNGIPDTGNGIANVAIDLAVEQRRRGHEVFVASSGGGFLDLLVDHGVPHLDVDFTSRNPAALAKAYRRLTAIIRQTDPEIVHAHTITPTVLGFLATRRRSPVLIATVHNEYQGGVALMGLADRVVGVSEAVSVAMAGRRVPRKKIRTVLNGIVGSPRRPSLPGQPSLNLPPQSIVAVGAVSHRKGADVLLAAFELVVHEFPKAHLYFVGHLDWTEPVDAAKEKVWSEQVHFVGFDAQPQRYLAEAAVFVLPSRRDPMPLSLLEAMGAGVPIVASDVDGIPEALEFGRAGVLARVGDPADLGAKITALLRSEHSRRRFADAARHRASAFTVETMTQRYLDVYRSAASR